MNKWHFLNLGFLLLFIAILLSIATFFLDNLILFGIAIFCYTFGFVFIELSK